MAELPKMSEWLLKKLQQQGQNAEDHLMFLRVERLLGAAKGVLEGEDASLANLRMVVNSCEGTDPAVDQGSLL